MLDDAPKPFLDHLEDLRRMILKSLGVLVVSMGLSCVYAQKILYILQIPLFKALEGRKEQPGDFLKTLDVMDAFSAIIQTGLTAGIIFASPVIFYFLAEFLLPALTPRERKMLVPGFLAGGVLFLVGAAFCYFWILSPAIVFFLELNEWIGAKAEWTLQNYLGFTLQMIAAFGISFELPLVICVLAKLGVVSSTFLKTYRRHCAVILVIFAACITPTSDVFSLMALFIPMYVLYEVGILGAVWIEHDRARQAALEERE